jgi:hypothetical protein
MVFPFIGNLCATAIGSFFAASFMAWRDQFREVNRLHAEVNDFEILPRLIPVDEWSHVFVFQNSGPEIYRLKFKLIGNIGRGLNSDFGVLNRREIELETVPKGARPEFGIEIGNKDPRAYQAEWSWKSGEGKLHSKAGVIRAERLPPDSVQY